MKITKQITVPGFLDYVAVIQECGDHPLPALTDEVLASVVSIVDCYIEEAETYEDTTSRIIVELRDGSFGVFSEWSDSSGHG